MRRLTIVPRRCAGVYNYDYNMRQLAEVSLRIRTQPLRGPSRTSFCPQDCNHPQGKGDSRIGAVVAVVAAAAAAVAVAVVAVVVVVVIVMAAVVAHVVVVAAPIRCVHAQRQQPANLQVRARLPGTVL